MEIAKKFIPLSRYDISKQLFTSCIKLRLPIDSTSLSINILHRYANSIGDEKLIVSNQVVLLSSILFLTGKVTENMRKFSEILLVTLALCGYFHELDEYQYTSICEKIIEKEQTILRELGFIIDYIPPYIYLLNISKYLEISCGQVKLAWTIINELILFKELNHLESVRIYKYL